MGHRDLEIERNVFFRNVLERKVFFRNVIFRRLLQNGICDIGYALIKDALPMEKMHRSLCIPIERWVPLEKCYEREFIERCP